MISLNFLFGNQLISQCVHWLMQDCYKEQSKKPLSGFAVTFCGFHLFCLHKGLLPIESPYRQSLEIYHDYYVIICMLIQISIRIWSRMIIKNSQTEPHIFKRRLQVQININLNDYARSNNIKYQKSGSF